MAKAKKQEANTDRIQAPSAITAEDIALDMELERMAHEEPVAAIEPDLVAPLTKEKPDLEHLREHLEGNYAAAKTLNELEHQVAIAKRLGCKAIDADPAIIRLIFGHDFSEKHGFAMYKDVAVHFPDTFAEVKAKSRMTVEQKVFGHSKSAISTNIANRGDVK
jgi:hypothetical protein